METQEITFGIYDTKAKEAKAILGEDGKLKQIKLLIKAPRRFYNSFINDADLAFREQYPHLYA